MALYFDFKEKMAIEFGRLIGQRVEPSELVFGEVSTPPAALVYNTLVPVTARGVTRQIAFNRIELASLVSNIPQSELVVDAPEEATRLHQILDLINNRLGTRFSTDDILDADLSPGTYPTWIKAPANHMYYKGQAQVVIKTAGIVTAVRPALHVYSLQGDTADTGTDPIDMGVAFNYQEIEGRKFAFLQATSGHVPFAPGLKFKVAGDFTIDMEVYIDAVYGYLYMMTNLGSGNGTGNTYGTLAFYGNKFYHYGFTPSGSAAWQNQMPAITPGKPARLTLRSVQGYTSAYLDGVFVMQWPSQGAENDTSLVGFRNADGSAAQWPSGGCGISNFKYWDVGLSNSEMDLLFGTEIPSLRPLQHWPLAFDGHNEGESARPWLAPMTFTEVYGRKMARCASQGAAFGSAFNFNRPFTLQFDYYASAASSAIEGIFTDSSLGSVNSALKMVYGLLYLHGGSVTFSTTQLMQNKQLVKITLMRTIDGRVHGWCDSKYLGATMIPANSPLLTNFGRANELLNMSTNHFANIKYWERSFDGEELKQIIGPKAQILALCQGGTGLSGATVIFDGNLGTYWNVIGDPTVTGQLPEDMVGKYIHSFRVYFATDNTNYRKKVRTWYIDQKDENGDWKTIIANNTLFCRNLIPDNETVQLTVPVLVTGREVRIRGVGNWGDSFGYRWCTEILFHYGADDVAVGGNNPPPKPLHHWPLNGDTSNKGRSATPLSAIFNWQDYNEKRWASHASPRIQSLGVSLPINTVFTFQFRIVSKSNQVVDKLQGIFSDSTGNDAGPVVKVNCNDSPLGDWFAYMPGVYGLNRLVAKAYKPGSENVVTIRGLNGVMSIWLNGELVLITTAPAGFTAWTHIGKAGTFMDSNQLIRDIKYWDTYLTDLELDYVFDQNAKEIPPEIPDTEPVEIVNPYPALTMPTFGWGFDDTNMFNSVGIYSDVAPLSGNEFEVLEFEGEKYFSPKLNMGELPLSVDVDRDFTLDFEIVASTYADSWQYGSILSSIRTAVAADLQARVGELMTWRNISAAQNNAPVMIGVGYTGQADSNYRPGLGEFKTRFTLRRKGNVFTWWRNGEQVWQFTNSARPLGWRFFGSVVKRNLHLGRRFAFWDSALPDASMAVLFGRPGAPLPQALHHWPLDTDTRNLGSDGTPMPGVWSPHVAASKSFMKPNTSVVLPTELALNTAGEYTIDFEVSHNPGSGYGAFLSTTSWNTRGAFTYYGGKLYHYLITPSGSTEWTNQPVVSIDAPVRYTIMAKGGIEYWYINGELKFQHASNGPGSLLLRGIQVGVGLRMFSYWPKPLTDDELITLFSPPPAVRKPKYHYSFTDGALSSEGTDPTPIALPIASTSVVGNDTLIKLSKTSDIDLGVDLPIASDFTLMFKVKMAGLPNYNTLLSTSRSAQAAPGTMMFNYGKFYQAGVGYSSTIIPPALKVGTLHEITLRSISGVLEIYIDGVKVHSYDNPGNHAPYRYLGDGNTFSSQWPTTNELGRIAYWPVALTDIELAAAFRGEPLV